MKKLKWISGAIVAALLTSALVGCSGDKADEKDYSSVNLTVSAYRDLSTDPYNNSYGIGAQKFMEQYPGSTVTFQVAGKEGGNEQIVAAINSGDVWNVQLMIGVALPGLFQSNLYTPLDEYIDKDNPIYTKDLIETATTYLGKTYGLGNVMMSDFYYGIYNETMYQDYNIKTPYEYYEEGKWNRESFLAMIDQLKANQVGMNINFEKPSKTGTYAVERNADDTVNLTYDKVPNREWLTFIKNIVYDKGVENVKASVAQRQIGFKQDILPHILVDAVNANPTDQMRYIPFLTKENPISSYIVEYYFGVPNGAKDIEASVELINYMIEACVEDRTNMYKDNMLEDDYKIFEETALNSHYIVRDCGVWPTNDVVQYFRDGGAVSTHIAENVDRMQSIVDDYNKKVEEQRANQESENTAK